MSAPSGRAAPAHRRPTGVLFVCAGNICRSPTAQGVFEHRVARAGLAGRIIVDSAGTHGYHVGDPPDARAVRAAARRGYDLARLRAREVEREDFRRFDYILAMDLANLQHLQGLRPADYHGHLGLAMAFASHLKRVEVPDPYYGGPSGFEHVLDLLEAAVEGLLARIRTVL